MFLITAATEFEMKPFQAACRKDVARLVTGIGPVETAVNLYSWLSRHPHTVRAVVNFGVAGAYLPAVGKNGPQLLDICLAEKEVLGDLGICLEDRIERFGESRLQVPDSFSMDGALLNRAVRILRQQGISFFTGTFVTVCCASGTAARGEMLAGQYRGLCENMEGAAVARVCRDFGLPCLELRCISNVVEDRDIARWQLPQACRKAGQLTAGLMEQLADEIKTGENQ